MKRIITTNVNGIRAAEKKGFFDWIKTQDADVVCLQEIKAQEDQLDELFYPKEYHCYYQSAEKKGYSGTAIFSKQAPTQIIKESPWDDINFEGRFIQADFKDFSVISIYIHSGSAKQERQDLKMAFLSERFMPYLQELKASGRKVIICGDVNIVHQERDIKNWKANQKNSGCLPQERAWLDELFFEVGFIDGFREVNQASHQYTWWSNRGQSWANNVGWRIDYQILTPNLKGAVKSASIYKDERFSDHAPLIMDYQL
ncbi:exodeoxyribonuclease III [bacterium endosymbiont of Bathymodiolus sp. 5 South]|jgi:exodeoxyribonuclease-3|uniref:exodeoxyribonuclease III n=1 Tax=bacterium endosymbiont of Bathymodiolus sp. 5 South TaxID=1181670 RepID=UPI0010BB693A|nr:exodeoxyribonuclease III [bacterium endosymbiont of Bathymodiolus sp. 5 South]CAC9635801.1 Exodeoxyribonuclease III (EC 3.1.11.2) [uncultured Gammaproteobacteria bacterium]SHN90210.1 Exodeoxyribonuclease III [bacterium endosymbiont of Bathymodiolus sp. 5 South]VVH61754.1 Exodeoxyribonuclease III (EC [uncultured Gammaproteobacteria bacterium]VVM27721.1 Exodeoxyribonuclease III (EC [uncultured Gammaproteobacteria bacterium]